MTAGWNTRHLGDLCEILDSQRKPITKRDRVAGECPYYGATGIQDFVAGYLFDEPLVLVGEDGAKWASGDQTAFPVIGRCWVNNHAHVLRPKRDVLVDSWLVYFLVHSDLSEFVSGLTVPKLNQGSLRQIPIPIPPIPEQQRIVAILDEAFDCIAKARANCEASFANAQMIFESYLALTFDGSANGWVNSTIGQCTKFIDYRGKTPTKTDGGIRLITAKNVKVGYLQRIPEEFIAADDYDGWMTRGIPKMGDVLFTTEAPLANVAQLDTEERVAFAQRVIILQADESRLDSTFLKYMLLSGPVRQRIFSKGTGATVQGIKASLLRLIEISFPADISAQRELADRMDALSEEVKRLKSTYQQKLAALDALKKSLLHHAFSGQLSKGSFPCFHNVAAS